MNLGVAAGWWEGSNDFVSLLIQESGLEQSKPLDFRLKRNEKEPVKKRYFKKSVV